VQVKAAAREPGERAKVAVSSTKRDVDPIGACVGLRGTRIQVISRELRGEKIDIVEWAPEPATFVARALSPAKVSSVTVTESEVGPRAEPVAGEEQRSVLVVVPDNQLSLAIGKRGQNARLAAKLTGIRVDIKSEGEVEEERRREEEERVQGREALNGFAGVGPQLVERLIEAGLYSPLRIARAGIEALQAVPGVGEAKAAAIFALAEQWVVEHPVLARLAPAEPAMDEGDPAAGDGSAAGEAPAVDAVNAPVPDDSAPSGTG
jgi:N utilization substance protein A